MPNCSGWRSNAELTHDRHNDKIWLIWKVLLHLFWWWIWCRVNSFRSTDQLPAWCSTPTPLTLIKSLQTAVNSLDLLYLIHPWILQLDKNREKEIKSVKGSGNTETYGLESGDREMKKQCREEGIRKWMRYRKDRKTGSLPSEIFSAPRPAVIKW